MGDIDMSPPAIDAATSKAISIFTKVTIAAIVVFFFVICLSYLLHIYARCYWVQINEDPNIVAWRRRLARQRQQSMVALHGRGLDPTALQSLPVTVYNPKDLKEELECAVCLSKVSEGEKTRILPKCNHGFHLECIDMWFQSHSTCPLCRNSVISDDDTSSNPNNHGEIYYDAW